jgi:hypothetical protein
LFDELAVEEQPVRAIELAKKAAVANFEKLKIVFIRSLGKTATDIQAFKLTCLKTGKSITCFQRFNVNLD